MKLFTKKNLKDMSKDTSMLHPHEIKVRVKLFDLCGSSKWFLYEYDPKTKIAQAFCLLNGDTEMSECGSVYIPELIGALGWRLERDISFQTMELDKVICLIKSGRHV